MGSRWSTVNDSVDILHATGRCLEKDLGHDFEFCITGLQLGVWGIIAVTLDGTEKCEDVF
jgi:hypothetical protein